MNLQNLMNMRMLMILLIFMMIFIEFHYVKFEIQGAKGDHAGNGSRHCAPR